MAGVSSKLVGHMPDLNITWVEPPITIKNGKTGSDVDIDGTCFQGPFDGGATYKQLVECFGEPLRGPNADPTSKITCEWALQADINGERVRATIYDWKVFGPTPLGKYKWHIGGDDLRAWTLVVSQFMASIRPDAGQIQANVSQ